MWDRSVARRNHLNWPIERRVHIQHSRLQGREEVRSTEEPESAEPHRKPKNHLIP